MPEITRRQLKMIRQAKVASVSKKRKGLSYIMIFIGIVSLLGFSVGIANMLGEASKKGEAELGVESFANLGQEHIANDAPKPNYNSNPPTSGPHFSAPANWGVYEKELPDQQLVHNLEHGGIWISYNCARDTSVNCDELKKQISDLAGKLKSKIIVTPRAANERLISVAGWTKLMHLDKFDAEKIEKFYKTYRDKAPEGSLPG